MGKEKLLENWGLVNANPYLPPELSAFSLVGDVYGDEKRAAGKKIVTSCVVGKVGDMVKTYSGSLYKLGTVHPEYEKLFPNARERVLKALPEESVMKKEDEED
jgi:hypothetical protein